MAIPAGGWPAIGQPPSRRNRDEGRPDRSHFAGTMRQSPHCTGLCPGLSCRPPKRWPGALRSCIVARCLPVGAGAWCPPFPRCRDRRASFEILPGERPSPPPARGCATTPAAPAGSHVVRRWPGRPRTGSLGRIFPAVTHRLTASPAIAAISDRPMLHRSCFGPRASNLAGRDGEERGRLGGRRFGRVQGGAARA